jgi:hypothetical protein
MDIERIRQIDLSDVYKGISNHAIGEGEFLSHSGKEHYKLLAYLGTQFNGCDIFDIGTHRGASALALSFNKKNTIHSFDISNLYPLPRVENIEYHIEDVITDTPARAKWEARLLASPLIFLDIDPHEGAREYEFYLWLKSKNYAGTLLCDDIWYFKQMRDNFWYKIPTAEKVDVTEHGHWSGTGVVRFVPSTLFPALTVPNNWTIVTAYFDLTKMPDASASIRARPDSHYLSNAVATLSLDQNMIIFCEPENLEKIRSLRPSFLEHKTRYITHSFEDFPLTRFRNKVIENRRTHPYRFDDRNTASYYLFCMSRYAMLLRAIAENPFGSTHFAWLNICIERMGYKNLMELDSVFAQQRDKFSTCYIDYRPRSLVENLPEYFRYGGLCSMCSGFFTGNTHFMTEFCKEIHSKFLKFLEAGYGHADEQLFSAVYFDRPELFDVYYGDYSEMIRNYTYVKERCQEPLRLLIAHSYDWKDYTTCLKGCTTLWNSYKKGYATLSGEEVGRLVGYYRGCCRVLGIRDELP